MRNLMKAKEQFAGLESAQETAENLGLQGYESLIMVLRRAFLQAAEGKGRERHSRGEPFEDQPMQDLIRLYGPGFALGQAGKKMHEAQRLPADHAVHELLGAINYIAGAVIAIEASGPKPANDNRPSARKHG